MIRIAVINDGRKILPFSMKAMASVYEYETEWINGRNVSHMKDTGEALRVEDLIETQNAYYTADYPIDPEDVFLEKYRIQELVCGEIHEVIEYALFKIRMSVKSNICGSMDDFREKYMANSLDTITGKTIGSAGRYELKDYIEITGPDEIRLIFGYEQFGFELTPEDKLQLLDDWVREPGSWCFFDTYVKLFDVPIGLKRALRYAWCFMHYGAEDKTFRIKDLYDCQKADLFHFILLTAHVDKACLEEFLGWSLLFAAEHRLILFAEFLMDQKASIEYYDSKNGSLSDNTQRTDLTIKAYLEHYRRHGTKKPVDTSIYFKGGGLFTSYSPQFGSSRKVNWEEIL
ncbi:MAG: hypothetical protein J5623_00275 [Clostridiales bacterium]|nr:hypothetical protein [Clostridiales bacterium]